MAATIEPRRIKQYCAMRSILSRPHDECDRHAGPSFSETPLTLLVGAQRPQEVDAAEGGPIHVGEVEFAEHALPQEESGKPNLPAGPDDEVGVGKIRSIEGSADCVRSYKVDDLLQ